MKPPQYRENTITRYRLVEEHLVGEGKEVSMPLMTVPPSSGSTGTADTWGWPSMYFSAMSLTSQAEKRKILQDDYDIQMTQTMEREVSVMCNLSKGVADTG